MMLATDLAVLDHTDGSVLLIANAINYDDTDERVDWAHADAVERLDRMTADLAEPAPSTVAAFDPATEPTYDRGTTSEDYRAAVERGQGGDPGRRGVPGRGQPAVRDADDRRRRSTSTGCCGRPTRARTCTCCASTGFDVVGSSPEALVKVADGRAMMHPIAGTRWRGETPEEDAALAADLLADPKERAEHLMLVDLGRNDLGRVCAPGTVEVVDFMSVERYSHVMHIVSTVVGEVAADRTAFDVLAACFPAGTLSGAPKPRAMEIIEELEPTRRGVYGGCVGYLDFAGDADTAIAIRTALLRDGVAYVQAGGGIVADSDPAAEDQESLNKAQAVLRAVATAAHAASGDVTPRREATAVLGPGRRRRAAAARDRAGHRSRGTRRRRAPRPWSARGRGSSSPRPSAVSGWRWSWLGLARDPTSCWRSEARAGGGRRRGRRGPGTSAGRPPDARRPPRSGDLTARDTWEALDRGEDPTA